MNAKAIPEIVRFVREGRYLLGEVRGQEEFVILARFVGNFRPSAVSKKVARLRRIK